MLEDVASHGSARLLMVRKAGASFTSDLNIRSLVFEEVLEEFASAGMELEQLREQLVDQLHAVVPQTADRTNRNLLLKTKRAVFNRRPIGSLEAVSLEPTLQKNLARYNALLARRTELLDSTRHEVFDRLCRYCERYFPSRIELINEQLKIRLFDAERTFELTK